MPVADGTTVEQSPAVAWRQGVADAGEIRIAYEEAGPATGDVVLLITGLSWQLIHWPEAFCKMLVDKGLRVVRLDNRDAGLSSGVKGRVRISLAKSTLKRKVGLPVDADYTLYDMADDVLAFMDSMGIAHAHLVGLSMGGMISQLIAGRNQERVLSLTSLMSSTNHPWLPRATAAVSRHILRGPGSKDSERIIAHTVELQQMTGSPGYVIPDAMQRDLATRAYERAYRPGGIIRQTHAIIATGSLEGLLGGVRAPTQIIHGDADTMLPLKCGKRSAHCIADAKLTVIPGMGHDLPPQLLSELAGLVLHNIYRV